jgi:valyl-tRNA synthetase
MIDLPKQYDPAAAQERFYAEWLAKGYFHADPASAKPAYAIVIPPPNVTGALHLGHALNNTIQDILIRWRRMRGYDALWMPGTDHAGIATQAVVERRIFEQEKKTRRDLGREALVERIWTWKDEYEKRILGQLRLMGCSCDWERTRFTLDAVCARAVRATFFRLFDAGLIYRGKRLVNWDAHLRTAVADDEIFYEDTKGSLWTIAYPVVDSPDEKLLVATTRPETMLGDSAVAVHPEDDRYKHLIGKYVLLPLMNRRIPIVADAILVDPKFGTGCVKVTPAHDPNDYQTGLRHGLAMINLLNPDGTFNENAGPYAGLDRKKVRERVIADLESLGLLVKTEPYVVRLNFSDRSKTPIEPYLSDQWFVRMDELARDAIDAVTSGRVRIHPERYAKSYVDWLAEKRDWCVSRQLWWGHRIPIWHAPDIEESRLEKAFAGRSDVRFRRSEDGSWLICAETDLVGDELGSDVPLERDPDVLDTWFSSALWPHSTLGWPEKTPELAKYYPTSVLSTARDIISLWVARMVVLGLFNLNEVPFKDVYIHPVIQDGQGKRMSKTAGNGIDPVDVIELYGADALRFTLAISATETQDLRMPVEKAKLPDGRVVNTSERFELGRTFPNKFWNAARFAIMNLEGFDPEPAASDREFAALPIEDRWILHTLAQTTREATADLENFRFAELAKRLRDFTWGEFCDWYIEFIKGRLRDPDRRDTARRVLATVLDGLCRLLHPIVPFVTEQVWSALGQVAPVRGYPQPKSSEESVCIAQWPEYPAAWNDPEAVAIVDRGRDAISAIRNLRSENRVPDSAKIKPIVVAPEENLERYRSEESLICSLTNSSEIRFATAIDRPRPSASTVLIDAEIILPLEGLLDLEAERARHEKSKKDLLAQLASIDQKLSNESFVARAPSELVEKQRTRRSELIDQLKTIDELIRSLEG